MADEQDLYKKQLKTAGMTTGIFVVMFAFLVLFVLLSRGAWNRGLRVSIAETLSERMDEPYVLAGTVQLGSIRETECAAYHVFVEGSVDDGLHYAAVVRATTIYGPLPAVYLYTAGEETARFIGYAELHSKAEPQIVAATEHSAIDYWAKKLPAIIRSSAGYTEEVLQ